MKLQYSRRTVILGIALAGCLIVGGLDMILPSSFHLFAERSATALKLRRSIEQKEQHIESLLASQSQLNSWRKLSLPSDESRATTDYQHWLVTRLQALGLTRAIVSPGSPVLRADFQLIPVQIEAESSPVVFSELLQSIEDAPILHRITRVQVQPIANAAGDELRFSLHLEAMALKGRMASSASASLDLSSLPFPEQLQSTELTQQLGQRNPFLMGDKNPPSDRPAQIESQEVSSTASQGVAEHRLVAIVERRGKREAWIYDTQSHSHVILHESETAEMPGGQLQIVSIRPQSMDALIGNLRQTVELGHQLTWPSSVNDPLASTP